MAFMAFHVDGTQRTGRTQVLAGSATDAFFRINENGTKLVFLADRLDRADLDACRI